MIALLQEEKIKDYDILVIQEPWRHHAGAKAYNPGRAGFTLVDNGGRTCFYINKRIDSNSWYSTWHTEDVGTITLQLSLGGDNIGQRSINVHGIYNPSPEGYNDITNRGSLEAIREALSMRGESIIVGDFNLHHPSWGGPSYPRQHILSNDLLDIIHLANAVLALPRGTITRDYQGAQTTIDLSFITKGIADRLIYCGIDEEMENSSDHLPVKTILDLRPQEEPTRRPRRNWKAMDTEKFDNILKELLPEPLRDDTIGRGGINAYTTTLMEVLEKATEGSTPWAKPHERAKPGWTQQCTDIIKETRKLRRRCRTPQDWEEYIRVCDKKGKILKRHKRDEFRNQMQISEGTPKGLFGLAKWARNAAANTLTESTIPPLRTNVGVATTAEDKAEAMFQAHFPLPPIVPIDDIEGFSYPPPIEDGEEISEREIIKTAYKAAPDKAPGINGVTNRALRQLVRVASKQVRSLFNRCIREGIQPSHFKKAATVMLRKPGKKDYSEPSSYRPIALLDTLGKMLESIISERLRYAVETHSTLPGTQMGARRQRSVDTALQLITEKVHTIWSGQKRRVASLLSLDVSGAFDNVSHTRLLHNMKKRRVPIKLLSWVKDFLKERRTTLAIGGYTMEERRADVGIPQGSPLSPVLYLFYNADLLEQCDDIRWRVSATGFVDDVNILTYGESTERNCRVLGQIYDRCEQWARTHGSKFAEKKHELIHFSRTPKNFDMNASIILAGHEVTAKPDIRVLGVQLDSKLRWKAHLRQIEAKLVIRHKGASIIEGSVFGTSINAGKRKYTAIEKPVMAHGAATWYTPAAIKGARKGVIAKLRSIQGRALRRITGAYKATSTEALQVETNVPPIDIHLEKLVQKSVATMDARESGKVIDAAVLRIRNDLVPKRGRRPKLRMTPIQLKRKWMQKELGSATTPRQQPYTAAPWVKPPITVIASNKEIAKRKHDADRSNPYWRAYSDGSGRDKDVTAASVGVNWSIGKRLGGVGVALTHHGELEGLTKAAEELAEHCKASIDPKDRVYKVYSDSQTSIKVIKEMKSTSDQIRLRRIQIACEAIRQRGAILELHWVPGHEGIKGNEAADKVADEAHRQHLPRAGGTICELAAKKALIQDKARKEWRHRWPRDKGGTEFRKIAPGVTHKHMQLHSGRPKPYSSLLVQLRTGKIGFNQFLCERRVPGVTTGTCDCGQGRMTVKHVLLACPTWRQERAQMQREAATTDLRRLLGEAKPATAAIRMVLSTNLLKQFQATAPPEMPNSESFSS